MNIWKLAAYAALVFSGSMLMASTYELVTTGNLAIHANPTGKILPASSVIILMIGFLSSAATALRTTLHEDGSSIMQTEGK